MLRFRTTKVHTRTVSYPIYNGTLHSFAWSRENVYNFKNSLISIEAGGLSTILTSAFLLQKNIQEWSDLNTFKSRITARYIIDKKKVSRVSLRTCQVQIKYRVINMDIYWRIRFRLCYYKDLFTHKDINTYINGVV